MSDPHLSAIPLGPIHAAVVSAAPPLPASFDATPAGERRRADTYRIRHARSRILH